MGLSHRDCFGSGSLQIRPEPERRRKKTTERRKVDERMKEKTGKLYQRGGLKSSKKRAGKERMGGREGDEKQVWTGNRMREVGGGG